MRSYHVYIMASRSRTLYVGMTNDLGRRVHEHKAGAGGRFTSRYRVDRLVYCEEFGDVRQAIAAEKVIKAWRREKKIALIARRTPTWTDLGDG